MKSVFRIQPFLRLVCISVGILCAESFPSGADFTGNGKVDWADFSVFSSSWGMTIPWFPDGVLPQMIAHWPLDQNALDSQALFDGNTAGTPVWFTRKDDPNDVKIGNGAVGLDGQDYIEIENTGFPHFFNSFTLEAWFKTSYNQQTQMILSKGNSSWQIGIEAGTGKAFFSCSGLSDTNYLAGNTFLADGIWHHLAGVYDQDEERIYLYLDGYVETQAPASGQVNRNNLNIRIGGNPQTEDGWWQGTLDNICVYNYALTQEQLFDRNTFHVDVINGLDEPDKPDPEWGKGRMSAFKTIQHAIDVAGDGDLILVWPGIYQESLFFMSKAVTVRSAADAAILEADPADGIAVTFMYGEQAASVLEHFVITNSDVALWIHQSSPTLRHLTVANNGCGINSIYNAHPTADHCIFWNNSDDILYTTYPPVITYSCLQEPYEGTDNFSADPLFVNPDNSDPNTMDYHLRSAYGRYCPDGTAPERPRPQDWRVDDCTSPCIDAGQTDINPFRETMCNGGRINIGAYGNTLFAGKSPWCMPADMDYSGRIDPDDLALFSEQWLNSAIP